MARRDQKGRKAAADGSAQRTRRVSSVRVGDMRASGAVERTRRGRALAMGTIVVASVLAALAVVGVALYMSGLFRVEEVSVSGVHHLTAEEMSSLAGVPASATLLRIDTADIKQRLKTNPWVKDVQVKRQFPHTIELQIVERDIAAVVEVTSEELQASEDWAISSDGVWLISIPQLGSAASAGLSAQVYDDAASVLHITSVPLGIRPEVGSVCSDESVLNALAIVTGLTTPLADRIAVVSATDTLNTLLTLDNGIQIAFGTADNVRDKERVCLQLLERYPDQISYINVRVVERPTWRAVPTTF